MVTHECSLQCIVGYFEVPGVGAGNGGLELAFRALFSKVLESL
jgi:hypothetical protein